MHTARPKSEINVYRRLPWGVRRNRRWRWTRWSAERKNTKSIASLVRYTITGDQWPDEHSSYKSISLFRYIIIIVMQFSSIAPCTVNKLLLLFGHYIKRAIINNMVTKRLLQRVLAEIATRFSFNNNINPINNNNVLVRQRYSTT